MRLATIILLVMLASSLLLEEVKACYQDAPSVQLRARTIMGTVTLHGKPFDGAVLRLHKFRGAYAIEIGHAESHVLSEVVTAKDGTFKFGEVPDGKYVVFVGWPSGASMEVELIKPKSGESDTVAIENLADSCIRATVISADGRRLTDHSVLTIFGRGNYNKESQ